jgi:hypothetical protein
VSWATCNVPVAGDSAEGLAGIWICGPGVAGVVMSTGWSSAVWLKLAAVDQLILGWPEAREASKDSSVPSIGASPENVRS